MRGGTVGKGGEVTEVAVGVGDDVVEGVVGEGGDVAEAAVGVRCVGVKGVDLLFFAARLARLCSLRQFCFSSSSARLRMYSMKIGT